MTLCRGRFPAVLRRNMCNSYGVYGDELLCQANQMFFCGQRNTLYGQCLEHSSKVGGIKDFM